MICQGGDLQLCIKSGGSELVVLYTLIFFPLGNKEESKKVFKYYYIFCCTYTNDFTVTIICFATSFVL